MISGTNLTFSYGDTRVVDDVSLATRPGKVLGLIGPNGSGKTTLLRLLHGALKPEAGHVQIDDTPITEMTPRRIARQLAVVVQESEADSNVTVGEMVLLGRAPYLKPFARTKPKDHAIAADALQRVGVAHYGQRTFGHLSGGERQRVLIARALAQQGQHLLLDEPTNHLDIRYQHEILHLVRSLGTTTLIVLHDLNLAAQYCDELVMLSKGAVAASGKPEEVLDPELIEQVYGITARRYTLDGRLQLSFSLEDEAQYQQSGVHDDR